MGSRYVKGSRGVKASRGVKSGCAIVPADRPSTEGEVACAVVELADRPTA
jgi:hypothetical protein